MRTVTVETQTWLAARDFLLDRSDDFFLQLTRARETFEAEAIHDLRVSSRRLREGITLFSHCFRKRQLTRLRNELKGLTAMLGSIRNSDEALLFFTPLLAQSPAASSSVMDIVASLQANRTAEERKLKRELKKINLGSLQSRIDAICNNPRIFNPNASGLFQPIGEYLLAAMKVREKPMLELYPEALKEENVTAQHRLRITVKRFRYRLEFLAPLSSGAYKQVYNSLKEYQEVLGKLHDLDVFSSLTKETTGDQSASQLLKKIITDRRRLLFSEFLQLRKAYPLNEMGALVQGLL